MLSTTRLSITKSIILFIATLFGLAISLLQGWLQWKMFGPYEQDSLRMQIWFLGICTTFIFVVYFLARIGHYYFMKNPQEYNQIYHHQKRHQNLLNIFMIIMIIASWFVQ